jgi:hypothetical protein
MAVGQNSHWSIATSPLSTFITLSQSYEELFEEISKPGCFDLSVCFFHWSIATVSHLSIRSFMAVSQTVIGQLPLHLDECKTNRCQSIVLVSQIAPFFIG